jgi:hypothetical protein
MRNRENPRSRLLPRLLSRLSWVCQTTPSTAFARPLNRFKISMQLLGSLWLRERWSRNLGGFSIGFLHQLPMSLAHNAEIVIQMLPYLNSLSELPAPLKRYELQIRFAVDGVKWDKRLLMFVVATLQYAL